MEFNKRCYRQKGESVLGEIVCNENYASLGLQKKQARSSLKCTESHCLILKMTDFGWSASFHMYSF